MVYKQQDAHYCHVSVKDYPDDVLEKVMGYKGAYFKAFTEVMKLKYVWWNKDTKVIELWGKFNRMRESREAMEHRIIDVLATMDSECSSQTEIEFESLE